jgi:hypothetical protein
MFRRLGVFLLFSLNIYAAAISYQKEIKPIFDRRCAVCHSCYNSPCQLKLDSFEGTDRGGSKDAVYLVSRLFPQDPSRLFIDAQTTQQWRDKGFFAVTQSSNDTNKSIMGRLLDLKKQNPLPVGSYKPEEDLSCAKNSDEVNKFEKKHPHSGMPFGFPPLSEKEYQTIVQWLDEGAHGPDADEQKKLITPSNEAADQIKEWETFLNQNTPKQIMSSRYMYEHLFLAHIHFDNTDPREFYELVRSSTPPSEPIIIIPTVRPYDDPKVPTVYYRFRKIHSTIVLKTHLVFILNEKRMQRYKELFLESQWLETPHVMSYDSSISANPFLTFAQIPTQARYQFLLDNSQYVIDTFIRGPVCKGQVALNVIDDQFWVMFMDPQYDLSVQDPNFLLEQIDNLRLPTEVGSGGKIWNIFSNSYRDRYAMFYKAKADLYITKYPLGLPLDAIWKGENPEDAPMLTIFRHFDSASTHRGALGGLPKTMWVMDYAQFERMYYALVAGFDVYGNVTHQTNVRRYMDDLRLEGELNFINFLPINARESILQSWYKGPGEYENLRYEEVKDILPSAIEFNTDDPKRELVEMVVNNHLLPSAKITFDPYNYYTSDEKIPDMPKKFETQADYIQGFKSLNAPGTAFIREINDYGVDVLYLHVRNAPGGDRFISIVVNRWHDNVRELFNEKDRLDPTKDTMDFLIQPIGSYPNYFFDVDVSELPDFFDMMKNYDGSDIYKAKIVKYGINRANPKFWDEYDWFQDYFDNAQPMESGLYDLNRYYHKAF